MVRGDTLLQVTPNQPLSLAAGSSTTTTLARRYAFEIGASALDLDGDALPRLAHCPPCPAAKIMLCEERSNLTARAPARPVDHA